MNELHQYIMLRVKNDETEETIPSGQLVNCLSTSDVHAKPANI